MCLYIDSIQSIDMSIESNLLMGWINLRAVALVSI